MVTFLVRRSLRLGLILLLASVAVFYALRFAPGDPSGVQLSPLALQQVRDAYRARLGLDKPAYVQYFVYLSNLFRGNLGTSLVTGSKMGHLLRVYGENSLMLGLTAFLLSNLIGIPLGMLAAAKRNSIIDQVITAASTIAGMIKCLRFPLPADGSQCSFELKK